jgi:hypothetical protein
MAILACPECDALLTDIRPWFTGNQPGLGEPCERGKCPKCLQVWLQSPTTGAIKLVRLEPRCPECDSPFVERQWRGTFIASACPHHPEYTSVGDLSNQMKTREQQVKIVEEIAADPQADDAFRTYAERLRNRV